MINYLAHVETVLLTWSVLSSKEPELSIDTERCQEAARSKHPGDPNASLDHFLLCLSTMVNKVSIS